VFESAGLSSNPIMVSFMIGMFGNQESELAASLVTAEC
jgi:hypothetical protein